MWVGQYGVCSYDVDIQVTRVEAVSERCSPCAVPHDAGSYRYDLSGGSVIDALRRDGFPAPWTVDISGCTANAGVLARVVALMTACLASDADARPAAQRLYDELMACKTAAEAAPDAGVSLCLTSWYFCNFLTVRGRRRGKVVMVELLLVVVVVLYPCCDCNGVRSPYPVPATGIAVG